MTIEIFLAILAVVTLAAGIFFALSSKKQTDDRRRNPHAEKSTLAEDAPNTHKGGNRA